MTKRRNAGWAGGWCFQLAFVLCLIGSPTLLGHTSSDGFLVLTRGASTLHVRLELALRDLGVLLPIDGDGDGTVTWGELKSQQPALAAYRDGHLQFSRKGQPLGIRWDSMMVSQHTDGAYAVWTGIAEVDRGQEVGIDYQLVFEADRDHRGLVRLVNEVSGHEDSAIFSPDHPHLEWPSLEEPGRLRKGGMVIEGIHHIWTGYDHLLFLLALLLPSVASTTRDGKWISSDSLPCVTRRVIKVVTAFTAAHSLTLAMAALGWVRLPSRGVESVIALSVVAAAVNNLWPVFRGHVAGVAFVFGLIHGFGFASALEDLSLSSGALLMGLFEFNLGVELGQLTVVALFLPLAYWTRRSWAYQRVGMLGGSAAIALVAGGWLVERSFDLRFMPF